MRIRGMLLALAIAAVAGCGSAPVGPTPSSTPTQPAAVANRAVLPSCGVENAGQLGPWNETGRTCFWSAYQQHHPAEFISTRPTTEGDPITTIFRVLPTGSVEIFMDLTQDKFSSPADRIWKRFTCRTLSAIPNDSPSTDFGPDETCVASPVS